MKGSKFTQIKHRWFRFLVGGGINTAITYTIYLVLNLALNYQWSYLIAFISGIVFSYSFNSLVVFKVPLSWKGLLSYPMVYLIQYGASALLLGWVVETEILNETVAPLLVVGLTVPLTYVLSKVVINWSQ